MSRDDELDDLSSAAVARARSGLYRLLARIFRSEPDGNLLDEIGRPPLGPALAEAGVETGTILPQRLEGEPVERLCEEFARLFLGPGKHVSPHESVQLKRGSGVLWGEETAVVKRFIEAAGFDYDETYHGIPDHVSVELEFLGHLSAREADAIAAGETRTRLAVVDWQHLFISRHVGRWVDEFSRRVAEQAEFPFYPAFARLVSRFLATEKAHLARVQTAIAARNPTAATPNACSASPGPG
jgi:TorA maturation chaperone TorD